MWATCLGSGLSAVVAEVPTNLVPGVREGGVGRETSGGEGGDTPISHQTNQSRQTSSLSYTYGQLFMDALPFAVLYDLCLVLQVRTVPDGAMSIAANI